MLHNLTEIKHQNHSHMNRQKSASAFFKANNLGEFGGTNVSRQTTPQQIYSAKLPPVGVLNEKF